MTTSENGTLLSPSTSTIRSDGRPVTVSVSGPVAATVALARAPAPLDPGVELAAYRIVQEGLTNARRHAPGAAVDVELTYGLRSLKLRIRDNGPGRDEHGAIEGHGLTGMSERAAAVGGQLRAGPAAVGGFMVEATLPGAGADSPA